MRAGLRLLDDIERFFALRQHQGDDRFRQRLLRLQAFQTQRLTDTHASLLATPHSAPAVQFLLDEVYGDNDLRPVAHDIRRATRKAMKLLPETVMATSAVVLETTLLTQELDEAMTDLLGDVLDTPLDAPTYGEAYRALNRTDERERQLALIAELGHGIDRYVKSRMIQTTFRMVRKPAHAAGFSNLYDFLERGFGALRPVPSIAGLLGDVAHTERVIMQRLLDQHPQPFQLDGQTHSTGHNDD
ncbi:MAG: FFLEELY motif protein [Alcanivoracaceae bacterium]|jgi:hypothetical protein